jgi:hypothetical protein
MGTGRGLVKIVPQHRRKCDNYTDMKDIMCEKHFLLVLKNNEREGDALFSISNKLFMCNTLIHIESKVARKIGVPVNEVTCSR